MYFKDFLKSLIIGGVVSWALSLLNSSSMYVSGGSGSTTPPSLSGPSKAERLVTMTTRGRQREVRSDVGQRKQGVKIIERVSPLLDAKHRQSRRDPSWAGSNNLTNWLNWSDDFNLFRMRAESCTGILVQESRSNWSMKLLWRFRF